MAHFFACLSFLIIPESILAMVAVCIFTIVTAYILAEFEYAVYYSDMRFTAGYST